MGDHYDGSGEIVDESRTEDLDFYNEDDENNDDNEDPEDQDPDPAISGLEREPSYKRTNKLSFYKICERFERLSNAKPGSKFSSKEAKLKILLPPELIDKIHPHSLYPLFRLIVPDKDHTRVLKMKEKILADMYCDALGFEKNSDWSIMLHDFRNPASLAKIHSATNHVAGDFSLVVQAIIERRFAPEPSKATVGDINAALDRLQKDLVHASNERKTQKKETWNYSQGQSQSMQPRERKSTGKAKSQKVVRREFVRKLTENLKLSPLEQKWVLRIILGNVKIGLGFESIFRWYSIHSIMIWKNHNSMQAVCNKLCNADYVRQLEKKINDDEERAKKERFFQLYSPETSPDPVRPKNAVSAMRSERTSFEQLMAQISARHDFVIRKKLKNDPLRESLSLKFPAFISEVKLDGERMIVHVSRGKVTMQTRNANWYSRIYSPVIGPALRRALSNFDVDVILDGEVLAWDESRKQNVPFGNNKTVAAARKRWMKARGEIEDIDMNLHEDAGDDRRIMTESELWSKPTLSEDGSFEEGEDCWLKFVAFDILFVGGPDAEKVIGESLREESITGQPLPSAGSITNLSGFERKKILYHLIRQEANKIEIVESVVIRPNGSCLSGEDYFSSSKPVEECGLPMYVIDSAKWALNFGHPSLRDFDAKRRNGQSDFDISKKRTLKASQFYHQIVEERKLEGIVTKDLSWPYVLKSNTKTWLKIKPDYMNQTHASDLDVVVIGGTFAMGLRRSGKISSFLCACIDAKDPTKVMTFCRINAKGLQERELEQLMEHTGFEVETRDKASSYGKWFREEDHGTTLPDFISERSFQRGLGKEDDNGWAFTKDNYPDLFIRPEDSVVLTVTASEIVPSDEYSAGLTLRFPRINRARLEGDAKPADEVENNEDLYKTFCDYRSKMQQSAAVAATTGYSVSSPSKNDGKSKCAIVSCPFWTVEQYRRSQKQKKADKKNAPRVQTVSASKKESNALTGEKFYVFEGVYTFDENSTDAEQAKKEGWFEQARRIHCANDVRQFIKNHNGRLERTSGADTIKLGGSVVDEKVARSIRGYEERREKQEVVDKKRAKKGEVVDSTGHGIPGILKWAFVFSTVHRWLHKREELRQQQLEECGSSDEDEDEDDDDEDCIQQTMPQLLREPRFHDFLAKSKFGEDLFESILKHGDLDTIGMKHALTAIESNNTTTRPAKRARQSTIQEEQNMLPWQCAALQCLSAEDRWVMASDYAKLWPYTGVDDDLLLGFNGVEKEAAIVFPDLFGDDFGFQARPKQFSNQCLDGDERWKQVPRSVKMSSLASALPLLRSMGCLMTSHLHSEVTHVLVDLPEGVNSVEWVPGKELDVFGDGEHGNRLLQRLEDTMTCEVLLVSRNWVLQRWG